MIDLVQSRCHEGSPIGKRSLRWEVLTQYTNVMHKRKNVKQIDKNQEDKRILLGTFQQGPQNSNSRRGYEKICEVREG